MLTDPLRYDKPEDVSRRLYRTFILYKGRPVYVQDVGENLTIRVYDLGRWTNELEDPPSFSVHSSDVDINLESPKVGWCNVTLKSAIRPVFFLRTVHRQFSQGLDPRKTTWMDPAGEPGILQSGWSWRAFKDLVPLAKMIAGEGYPSILEASEEKTGRAFDRDWALTPTKSENIRTLWSDFTPVGYYNRSTKTFHFAPSMLTKVRRMALEKLFSSVKNTGAFYAINEHA
jgi:hypothetical protein